MTNLDNILKGRDITLATKVHIVKAMVFPVVMYRCESWTIKKVEHWRICDFKLWCLRRLLRVPWTARRSNQSILKKINPEYLLKGLMLKLKLQHFGYLVWRTDSLEKSLMQVNIESKRRRGWQKMRWLNCITSSMDMRFRRFQEIVKDRGALGTSVHGVTKSQTGVSDWTRVCIPNLDSRAGLPQAKLTGSKYSPNHKQIFGLKFYWAWPSPPEQDLIFPIHLMHQMADRSKNYYPAASRMTTTAIES